MVLKLESPSSPHSLQLEAQRAAARLDLTELAKKHAKQAAVLQARLDGALADAARAGAAALEAQATHAAQMELARGALTGAIRVGGARVCALCRSLCMW